MQTSTKTTVEIIQALISLQSAKQEKLLAKSEPSEQKAIDDDPIIKKLMTELSLHGDAVGSTVEKTDPYYDAEQHNDEMFKQAVEGVVKQAGELPDSLREIIQTMN